MRARTCRFLPWLKRFEFRAPLVEASWSYPQFSRQLTNVFARPHPLHGHSLKFPGVSLPLHGTSFPGNCAQSCVSLQGVTPGWQLDRSISAQDRPVMSASAAFQLRTASRLCGLLRDGQLSDQHDQRRNSNWHNTRYDQHDRWND